MRPSMGGPGIQPQHSQRNQTGPMSILMPLYTIGIVCFFVYTVLKVSHNKLLCDTFFCKKLLPHTQGPML
jgi:hypothetical protein